MIKIVQTYQIFSCWCLRCIWPRGGVDEPFNWFWLRLWFMLRAKCGDGDEVIPAEGKEHVEDDYRDVDEDDQGKQRLCRCKRRKMRKVTNIQTWYDWMRSFFISWRSNRFVLKISSWYSFWKRQVHSYTTCSPPLYEASVCVCLPVWLYTAVYLSEIHRGGDQFRGWIILGTNHP